MAADTASGDREKPRQLGTRWEGFELDTGEYVIYDQKNHTAWLQSTHAIAADDAV